MSIIGTLIDIGLTASSVATIKENHTEAKTKKEKKEQWERRRTISDMRNVAYLARKIFR